MQLLCGVLCTHDRLRSLALKGAELTEAGVRDLVVALGRNRTLETLDLRESLAPPASSEAHAEKSFPDLDDGDRVALKWRSLDRTWYALALDLGAALEGHERMDACHIFPLWTVRKEDLVALDVRGLGPNADVWLDGGGEKRAGANDVLFDVVESHAAKLETFSLVSGEAWRAALHTVISAPKLRYLELRHCGLTAQVAHMLFTSLKVLETSGKAAPLEVVSLDENDLDDSVLASTKPPAIGDIVDVDIVPEELDALRAALKLDVEARVDAKAPPKLAVDVPLGESQSAAAFEDAVLDALCGPAAVHGLPPNVRVWVEDDVMTAVASDLGFENLRDAEDDPASGPATRGGGLKRQESRKWQGAALPTTPQPDDRVAPSVCVAGLLLTYDRGDAGDRAVLVAQGPKDEADGFERAKGLGSAKAEAWTVPLRRGLALADPADRRALGRRRGGGGERDRRRFSVAFASGEAVGREARWTLDLAPCHLPATELVGFAAHEFSEGHGGEVTSVAVSGDGNWVATGSCDKTARVWDADSGACLATLTGHGSFVRGVAFSPDGTRVATASQDHTAKVWDAATGSLLRTLEGHELSVNAVAFSPDGHRLATASRDKTALGHDSCVNGIAFAPDGSRVATASNDKRCIVWDASTGEELESLEGHENWVEGCAFSPDGRRVATASQDHHARVWEGGVCVMTLAGHGKRVNDVAFAGDGATLVTASDDETAKSWDLATGACLETMHHRSEVNACAFGRGGTLVATACNDRTAKLWDAATAARTRTLNGCVRTAVAEDACFCVGDVVDWDEGRLEGRVAGRRSGGAYRVARGDGEVDVAGAALRLVRAHLLRARRGRLGEVLGDAYAWRVARVDGDGAAAVAALPVAAPALAGAVADSALAHLRLGARLIDTRSLLRDASIDLTSDATCFAPLERAGARDKGANFPTCAVVAAPASRNDALERLTARGLFRDDGDTFAAFLGHLRPARRLRHLDLSGNGLGVAGATLLREWLFAAVARGSRALESLVLRDDDLVPRAVEQATGLPRLELDPDEIVEVEEVRGAWMLGRAVNTPAGREAHPGWSKARLVFDEERVRVNRARALAPLRGVGDAAARDGLFVLAQLAASLHVVAHDSGDARGPLEAARLDVSRNGIVQEHKPGASLRRNADLDVKPSGAPGSFAHVLASWIAERRTPVVALEGWVKARLGGDSYAVFMEASDDDVYYGTREDGAKELEGVFDRADIFAAFDEPHVADEAVRDEYAAAWASGLAALAAHDGAAAEACRLGLAADRRVALASPRKRAAPSGGELEPAAEETRRTGASTRSTACWRPAAAPSGPRSPRRRRRSSWTTGARTAATLSLSDRIAKVAAVLQRQLLLESQPSLDRGPVLELESVARVDPDPAWPAASPGRSAGAATATAGRAKTEETRRTPQQDAVLRTLEARKTGSRARL
ncbi:hypothetical protein JL722_3872 [Aureococcus anophagefferens]|nr:hypothetical protein JL722_3872 [Aureococcus anophagefferens]